MESFFKSLTLTLIKNKIALFFGILIFVLTLFGSNYFFTAYCESMSPAKSEFAKLPVLDPVNVSPGFTLFTNLSFNNNSYHQGIVHLVDLYGREVHKWQTKNKTLYAMLKPNGNLLVSQSQINDQRYPSAARITSIQELDEKSNITWEYKNDAMHHDFDVLPNGNIAVLAWEKVPTELASKIKGGKTGTELNKQDIFSDKILEIDPNSNIVWSWSAYKYLNLEEDMIPSFFNREQWTHANSLKYIQSDPFHKKEAYLVSMRYLNTIFLISKETGEIIWKAPTGLLGHQHDATLLNNGNILVFNNAFYSAASDLNPFNFGSQVLEINPKTNKVEWEFSGGDNPLDRARLTEVILSGAQRLPNGNTLVTLGTTGHLFEVTPDKKVVWDFVNPYSTPSDQPFKSNYIFKARRYTSQDIAWLKQFKLDPPMFISYCR